MQGSVTFSRWPAHSTSTFLTREARLSDKKEIKNRSWVLGYVSYTHIILSPYSLHFWFIQIRRQASQKGPADSSLPTPTLMYLKQYLHFRAYPWRGAYKSTGTTLPFNNVSK
jgi:hypothetical protein